MHLTSKSRVITPIAGSSVPVEVSGPRTPTALGTSRIRGAGATLWRKLFAGRSAPTPAHPGEAVKLGGRLAALAALALLAACDPKLTGNGIYLEKPIDPGGQFTGVHIEDGVGAVITLDAGRTQSVTLTGDENLVRDHIKYALEVEGTGGSAVTLLHVWVEPSDFRPVIPPKVVIVRPDLSVARGQSGAGIELKRPSGSTAVGGSLLVGLARASLDAQQYPTAGAVVFLVDASQARLHSDGPVTGSVSADSHLDNLAGLGPCLVATTAAGTVSCNN